MNELIYSLLGLFLTVTAATGWFAWWNEHQRHLALTRRAVKALRLIRAYRNEIEKHRAQMQGHQLYHDDVASDGATPIDYARRLKR